MRIEKWITPILLVALLTIGIVSSAGANANESEAATLAASEIVPPAVSEVTMSVTTKTVVVEEEPTYPLTQEEIDLIALVTMAEAEGETELGKRLVIDTILNRMDDSHFPDTAYDVIYQPYQFSAMWCDRIDRCYVMSEIVELVKEELLERTNHDVIFFMAGGYSKYGEPMFKEYCHYFSSYD